MHRGEKADQGLFVLDAGIRLQGFVQRLMANPALPGIPTDGGFESVDASAHSARADSSNDFMFDRGPYRRFVGELRRGGVRGKSSLPGGESGVLKSPFYVNLLEPWLTNDTFRVHVSPPRILKNALSVETFVPGRVTWRED